MTDAADTDKKNRRRGFGCGCYFLAGLLGLALLAVFAFIVARQLTGPATGTVPRVQIRLPSSGTELPVDASTPVVVQTYDTDAVTRHELWVDGLLFRQQDPDPGEATLPATTQFLWQPDTEGTHVLVARAQSAEGRLGTSRPVVVSVRAGEPDAVGLLLDLQPGETVASVAAGLGTTPEQVYAANPGLRGEPPPGQTIYVPAPAGLPAEVLGNDEEQPADPGEPPAALAPPALDEPASPAEPEENAAPWDLPGDLSLSGAPPAAPDELLAMATGGCQVELRWRDNSDNESDFRIYRLGAGQLDFRPFADVAAGDQAGRLTYVDQVPLGGIYQYYVAALNRAGESPGPFAAVDVPQDGCAIQIPLLEGEAMAILQFEALNLWTNSQFDAVHCYLSLARLTPYSRIPQDEDNDLRPSDGGWNIALHASGFKRYMFGQPPQEPAPVSLECWGTRGHEDSPLGSFTARHPREEWDGRVLNGVAEGFRLDYRIEPYANLPQLREVDADMTIPVPRDLRLAAGLLDCETGHVNLQGGDKGIGGAWAAAWACLDLPPEQILVWEWDPDPKWSRREIAGFRVFLDRNWPAAQEESNWEALGEIGSAAQLMPIPLPSCDQTFAFQVEAFVSPLFPITSARSETLLLHGPPCPTNALVEISLETLTVDNLDDGCWFFCEGENLQAYGWGNFSTITEDGEGEYKAGLNFWTEKCHAGLGRACVWAPRRIYNHTYHFAEEDLRMCGPCQGYGPNQNTIQLTLREDDALSFAFWMFDSDDVEDDIWCGVTEDSGIFDRAIRDLTGAGRESKPFIIGPFNLEHWATMDQSFTWNNSGAALSDQDARCSITLSVRGLGRTP